MVNWSSYKGQPLYGSIPKQREIPKWWKIWTFLSHLKGFHSLLCAGWVLITVPQCLSSDMPEVQMRVGSWRAVPWPRSCRCQGDRGICAAQPRSRSRLARPRDVVWPRQQRSEMAHILLPHPFSLRAALMGSPEGQTAWVIRALQLPPLPTQSAYLPGLHMGCGLEQMEKLRIWRGGRWSRSGEKKKKKKRGRLCTQSWGSTLPHFRIPKVEPLGFVFAMTDAPWI